MFVISMFVTFLSTPINEEHRDYCTGHHLRIWTSLHQYTRCSTSGLQGEEVAKQLEVNHVCACFQVTWCTYGCSSMHNTAIALPDAWDPKPIAFRAARAMLIGHTCRLRRGAARRENDTTELFGFQAAFAQSWDKQSDYPSWSWSFPWFV